MTKKPPTATPSPTPPRPKPQPKQFNLTAEEVRANTTAIAKAGTLSILDFLDLLPAYKPESQWQAWRAFLAACFGLPLTPAELKVFQECTSRQSPPAHQIREAWMVVGRRGGKGRIAALVATYMACFRDYTHLLAPGARATIPIVAADLKQAQESMNYLRGLFSTPGLAPLVDRAIHDQIDLWNRVTIRVYAGSFKSLRGMLCPAAILDEVAFWESSNSTTPDTDVIDSIRPSMGTVKDLTGQPNAILLGLSSPWSKRGALWQMYSRYYGDETAAGHLVWQAPTLQMHPEDLGLAQEIATAYAEDSIAAATHYGALFRTDVGLFVSPETVKACTVFGRDMLPKDQRHYYFAFIDPSGGSSDSMTLGIAHYNPTNDMLVLDHLAEESPSIDKPFSPEEVTAKFSAIIRAFGLSRVVGDAYGGEWPRERFRTYGIQYDLTDKPKRQIYQDILPMLNSRKVELLDNPRLATQLCGLERRASSGGRELIDHRPGAHDDLCFPAGTLIATLRGDIPIEQVQVGDQVLVPGGVSRVTASGQTGVQPVITRHGITATAGHPVFVYGLGFAPLNAISGTVPYSAFERLSLRRMLEWNHQKRSSSKESPTDSWGPDAIILASQRQMPGVRSRKDSTSRSGKTLISQKFLWGLKSITSTLMCSTTILPIWSVYRSRSIARSLSRRVEQSVLHVYGQIRRSATPGIARLKDWLGIGSMRSSLRLNALIPAGTAVALSWLECHWQSSALPLVESRYDTNEPKKPSQLTALSVNRRSAPVAPAVDLPSLVAGVAEDYLQSSVSVPVFNLTTTASVYYANGVLVHNCNSALGALLLADQHRRAGMRKAPEVMPDTTEQIFRERIVAMRQKSISQWRDRDKPRANPYGGAKSR